MDMTKPKKMMPSRFMAAHTSISAGVLALMSPAQALNLVAALKQCIRAGINTG